MLDACCVTLGSSCRLSKTRLFLIVLPSTFSCYDPQKCISFTDVVVR